MKMKQEQILETLLTDAAVRRAVTRQSHKWFFSVFLSHYIEYEFGLFHEEMFALTEKEQKLTVVMAFRGSGKSTIMNLSYVLWAILGLQQKKFVVIASKTQSQPKNHLQNIRDELLHNDLLRQDLGPFEMDDNNWGMSSLVFPKMGARIMAASREHSMRGVKHGALRPDLIICDDVEDTSSGTSPNDQESTYRWLTSEVLPAGDMRTRVIVLGNLLGENSLLMRLRADILVQKAEGVFRAYPFSDDNGELLWPSKYDTQQKVKDLEASIPDLNQWRREFLLLYVKNDIIKLARDARELEAGRDPDADRPVQRLGKYVITAPHDICTFFEDSGPRWNDRYWAEEEAKRLEGH